MPSSILPATDYNELIRVGRQDNIPAARAEKDINSRLDFKTRVNFFIDQERGGQFFTMDVT